jgi:peptide/nickel transport system substrate-binding protein
LNLSLFDEKQADDLLVALREEKDENKRRDHYRVFQETLIKEHPALFLYSPRYLYVVSSSVKGIELSRANAPAHRLSNAKDWYIKTKRVRK